MLGQTKRKEYVVVSGKTLPEMELSLAELTEWLFPYHWKDVRERIEVEVEVEVNTNT